MANKITDTQHYKDIADAIRAKNGESTTYKPGDMAQAITDLPEGGGGGGEYEELMKNWMNRVKRNNKFYFPFPSGATQIPPYAFYWQATSPVSASSPIDLSGIVDTITTIGSNACRGSFIYMPRFPTSLNTLGQRAFDSAKFRSENGNITGPIIDVPAGVIKITQMAFADAVMQGLRFLGDITTIDTNGLRISNSSARTLIFAGNTAVPTLSSTLWSARSDDKIVVPDALYDEWIAATNWATVASCIIKASDYSG